MGGAARKDPLARWYSTNSRTVELAPKYHANIAGMSYRGSKNTAYNGVECVPWEDAYARCTIGYEAELIKYLKIRASRDNFDILRDLSDAANRILQGLVHVHRLFAKSRHP